MPDSAPLQIEGVTIEGSDIVAVLQKNDKFAMAVRMQALERMFKDAQMRVTTLEAEGAEAPEKKKAK